MHKRNLKSITELASDRADEVARADARECARAAKRAKAPSEEEIVACARARRRAKLFRTASYRRRLIIPLVPLALVPASLWYFIAMWGMIVMWGVPSELWMNIMIAAYLLSWPLLTYLLYRLLTALLHHRTRRWLDRVPYSWDRDAYEDLLSREYEGTIRLVVATKLNSRVPDDWQPRVIAAVEQILPGTELRWNDSQAVQFASVPLVPSYWSGGGEGHTVYSNYCLQTWFKRFAGRVLPVVHREFPVVGFECTVVPTTSWPVTPI